MTPQERQLINELFTRLASLEASPRDADAEAMMREGLRRAPNAVYSLVQTVLVQDEALKAANAHIQEYEQANGTPRQEDHPRGFLDSMRESIFGREEPRGSVPRVPPAGAPAARPDPWGQNAGQPMGQPGYQQPGYQQQAPMQPQYQGGGGGGSFLGTAAAAAAGMIGGSLLMGGIRSAMGGHTGGGPASSAFDSLTGNRGGSPWSGDAAGSGLARDAGLGDIGGSRRAGAFNQAQADQDADDDADADDSDDSGSDDSDSDTA
jgi:uncharacterized protein